MTLDGGKSGPIIVAIPCLKDVLSKVSTVISTSSANVTRALKAPPGIRGVGGRSGNGGGSLRLKGGAAGLGIDGGLRDSGDVEGRGIASGGFEGVGGGVGKELDNGGPDGDGRAKGGKGNGANAGEHDGVGAWCGSIGGCGGGDKHVRPSLARQLRPSALGEHSFTVP